MFYLVCLFIYLEEMYFYYQGHIKLLKSDSKVIFYVTKQLIFQINTF